MNSIPATFCGNSAETSTTLSAHLACLCQAVAPLGVSRKTSKCFTSGSVKSLSSSPYELPKEQRAPPHAAVARRALREMPSPGKSGSVFFLSDDDRFLIKTVSHEEMLLLLKLIPAYYRHCADNPTTLLTRFFGVHRVKPLGSQSKAGLPSCLPALQSSADLLC